MGTASFINSDGWMRIPMLIHRVAPFTVTPATRVRARRIHPIKTKELRFFLLIESASWRRRTCRRSQRKYCEFDYLHAMGSYTRQNTEQ
ncbi:hypothetical protein EVA_12061 [gut metagenome]|uniref:Uncharacterized protein n=1 Tax=gut metagenome TaxID=749906 RepID=J9GDI3_9ZZZZ